MDHRKITSSETPKPIIVSTRCVPSLLAWVLFVTYFYDGEPYDYMFEVGTVLIPEDQAKALVARNNYEQRAQAMFLRDVNLGPEFNDLELCTA